MAAHRRLSFAVAGLAALAAVSAPTLASAQSYGPYPYTAHGYDRQDYRAGPAYYDPCVRDQRQRQTAGGLIGAAIGTIAGSQIAARGNRTEGSVLGGVVGAAIGAGVGGGQAACRPGSVQPYPAADYGRDAYGYSNSRDRYDDRYDRYDDRYDRSRPDRDDDYGYRDDRSRGYPTSTTDYGAADGCRLAESRITLPDGRQDVRYVRTCPDASGRYRVVD